MNRRSRRALLGLLRYLDLAVVATAFGGAIILGMQRRDSDWLSILEMRVRVINLAFLAGYLIYWHVVLRGIGLYRSYRLAPSPREWRDLAAATLVGIAPLWMFADSLGFEFAVPRFFTVFLALAFLGLGIERRFLRMVARLMRRHGRNLRNVVVIGSGDETFELAARLMRRSDLGYHMVEIIDTPGWREDGATAASRVLEQLSNVLESRPVDEVFLTLPLDAAQSIIQPVVALCEEQGIAIRILSSAVDLLLAQAQVDEIDGRPVISIYTGPPDSLQLAAKRLIDLSVSGVALVVLAPVFAVVALAVKLESSGPVLFVQERVGLSGRRFRMHKFRTMVEDAEQLQEMLEPLNEAQGAVFKIRDDPRVTRVGHAIRRLSIDELPQLFDVFRGEMSLVGPRPLPLRDVARIDLRAHKRRQSVKPGITCLWQVSLREPEFEEWVRTDMEYIDNWSLALDMKILFKTIPAVLSGRGAY